MHPRLRHFKCSTAKLPRVTSVLAILLYVTLSVLPAQCQPTRQLRGVIHLDSTVSGGEMAPEGLVRLLRDNDIQVAIFSDQITTRVHYGVFPLPALTEWVSSKIAAAKFRRESSVSTFGAYNYLNKLQDLNRKYEDINVIPGVEVYPFYYWRENLLKGELAMVNGYKHFLALGMNRPSDYENMPTVSEGFFKGYNLQSLLSLWPIALLLFAFKCHRQARLAERPILFKIPAQIFLVVGILFLINNFPYSYGKYDAYGGDQGVMPYQEFINYVNARGGLTFFAHPEAEKNDTRTMGPIKVKMETTAPYKDLLKLHNLTGFAAFYEGMKYIIPPGGIWDQVLTEYCFGQRKKPLWAIAEGDVEGDAFDPGLSQTVILVKEATNEAILAALRNGQMYAMAGPYADDLTLERFTLSNEDAQEAGMGQTLNAQNLRLQAHVRLKESAKRKALQIDLIKNGILIDTFKGDGEIAIDISDSVDNGDRIHYYRLDVYAPNQTRLLTNPIFVHTQPTDS